MNIKWKYKDIGIAFFFLLLALWSDAQQSVRTGQVVTKKERVKLSKLTVLDSTFFKQIDDLSMKVNHHLNLYDERPSIFYLCIDSSTCKNITKSYSIYISREDQFMYVSGIYGFFEIGKKLLVVNGDSIPELFNLTGKSKTFEYIKTLGMKMDDGSILPTIADKNRIDDTRVALVYTYSNGRVEFEKIFECY